MNSDLGSSYGLFMVGVPDALLSYGWRNLEVWRIAAALQNVLNIWNLGDTKYVWLCLWSANAIAVLR